MLLFGADRHSQAETIFFSACERSSQLFRLRIHEPTVFSGTVTKQKV